MGNAFATISLRNIKCSLTSSFIKHPLSVAPDLGVIPPDTLSCGKPSVLLLSNHLLKAGPVLDQRREDEEDVADVRNKVSEGAVEEGRGDLSSLNVNMNPGYDGLRLTINLPTNVE